MLAQTCLAQNQTNWKVERLIEVDEWNKNVYIRETITIFNTGNQTINSRWWTLYQAENIEFFDDMGQLSYQTSKRDDAIDFEGIFRWGIRPGHRYTYSLAFSSKEFLEKQKEDTILHNWIISLYPFPSYNITTKIILPKGANVLAADPTPESISQEDDHPILTYARDYLPPETNPLIAVRYRYTPFIPYAKVAILVSAIMALLALVYFKFEKSIWLFITQLREKIVQTSLANLETKLKQKEISKEEYTKLKREYEKKSLQLKNRIKNLQSTEKD